MTSVIRRRIPSRSSLALVSQKPAIPHIGEPSGRCRGGRTRVRLRCLTQTVDKPLVCRGNALLQRDAWRPAELLQPIDVEQLPRRAIGFRSVVHDVTRIADDGADQVDELGYGDISARTDIDDLRTGV